MNSVYTESGLTFDFTRCLAAEKCDEKSCAGLKSVDFMAVAEKLYAKQRQKLHKRIAGYIPTGLNKGYSQFSGIEFNIPEISDTDQYGFTVMQAEQSQ